VGTTCVPMPKAAVHLNCSLLGSEDDVRATRQYPPMQTESIA
jgi:hypothetical protein